MKTLRHHDWHAHATAAALTGLLTLAVAALVASSAHTEPPPVPTRVAPAVVVPWPTVTARPIPVLPTIVVTPDPADHPRHP